MESKSPIDPRLVIIEGKDKGKAIPLIMMVDLIIGRSKGDVVVQILRVRSHVAIHYDVKTGKLSFADLKSLNGTQVKRRGQRQRGTQRSATSSRWAAPYSIAKSGVQAELTATNTRAELGVPPLAVSLDESTPVPDTNSSISAKPEPMPSVSFQPEPKFVPEEMDVERSYNSRPREPGFSAPPPPPREEATSPRVTVSFLAKIPPKARYAALGIVLLVACVVFLGKGGGPSPENRDRQFSEVRDLESSGKLEEAIARAETLKNELPDGSDIYLLLGDLYAKEKRNELAIASYRKAHDRKPDQPLVHTKLIQVLLRSGLTKEAQEELAHVDQMIRAGEHTKGLFVETAKLFLEFQELQQPPEKTLILAKALQTELAPDSTVGYKLEAQLHFQQSQPEPALHAMEKGLSIDPSDEWLLENIAFAKLSLHDVNGAVETVDSWLRLHPSTTKSAACHGPSQVQHEERRRRPPLHGKNSPDSITQSARLGTLLPRGAGPDGADLLAEKSIRRRHEIFQAQVTPAFLPANAIAKPRVVPRRRQRLPRQQPPPPQ